MSELVVESFENRSGSDKKNEWFGYVYFSDGSRVGYSPGIKNGPGVWEPRTNGGGKYQPVTPAHLRTAAEYLRMMGVPL